MTSMVVDLKKDKTRIAYGSEQEVEVYTENEVERLLFYIQDQEKVSLRDKLIVLLLLYTGIRVSELVSIRLKDLDFLTMQLHVVGKGGQDSRSSAALRGGRGGQGIYGHRTQRAQVLGQRVPPTYTKSRKNGPGYGQ